MKYGVKIIGTDHLSPLFQCVLGHLEYNKISVTAKAETESISAETDIKAEASVSISVLAKSHISARHYKRVTCNFKPFLKFFSILRIEKYLCIF